MPPGGKPPNDIFRLRSYIVKINFHTFSLGKIKGDICRLKLFLFPFFPFLLSKTRKEFINEAG